MAKILRILWGNEAWWDAEEAGDAKIAREDDNDDDEDAKGDEGIHKETFVSSAILCYYFPSYCNPFLPPPSAPITKCSFYNFYFPDGEMV